MTLNHLGRVYTKVRMSWHSVSPWKGKSVFSFDPNHLKMSTVRSLLPFDLTFSPKFRLSEFWHKRREVTRKLREQEERKRPKYRIENEGHKRIHIGLTVFYKYHLLIVKSIWSTKSWGFTNCYKNKRINLLIVSHFHRYLVIRSFRL